MHVVVHLREDDAPYRRLLTDAEGVRYSFCPQDQDLLRCLPDADVLLASIQFPAEALWIATRLKWIQVSGAGVDAFLDRVRLPDGVALTRADAGFGDQIGEYVIGHLLAHAQRLRDVYRNQSSRRWEPLRVSRILDLTLGVVGVGSIGRAVASRGSAMGMRVLGWATAERTVEGFDHVYGPEQLEEFLSKLDCCVIAVPLTPSTRGLFGPRELAALRETAVLINVARGPIVQEDALIDALKSGALASAVLDVFDREPLPQEHPFWELPGVTVTSHRAGLNVPERIAAFFLANLERFRYGGRLLGLVNPVRGY